MNPGSRRERPSLRTRAKEAARAEILEAAERCLVDVGARASMEAVASHAGVAVGTLYNYFGGREELITEVMQRRHAELDARLARACEASRDLADAIARLTGTCLGHFREHAGFFGLVVQDDQLRRRPSHGPGMQIVLRHARNVCATAVAQGWLPAAEPDLRADLAVGCIRGALLWLLAEDREAAAWQRTERDVIAFVVAGIARAP